MAFTEEQLKAAAKKAYAAGDVKSAQELYDAAMKIKSDKPAVKEKPVKTVSAADKAAFFAKPIDPMMPTDPMGRKPVALPGIATGVARGQGDMADPEFAREIGQRARTAEMGPVEAKLAGIAQGGAFNFGDELGAAVVSPFVDETYPEVRDMLRKRDKAAETAHPGAYYTGNVLGSIAAPVATGSKAIAAAPAAWQKIALAGLFGAGQGAAAGAGAGEEGTRLTGALQGGTIGGLAGLGLGGLTTGIASYLNAAARNKGIKAAADGAPDLGSLKEWAKGVRREMEKSGARMPQAEAAALAEKISSGALDTRKLGGVSDTPLGEKLLMGAEDLATDPRYVGGISPDDLLALRKRASSTAASINPDTRRPGQDAAVGAQALEEIDKLIDNLVGDKAAKSTNAFNRVFKAERLMDIGDRAEEYLSGTASGIANGLRAMLKNPKQARRYSAAELAALKAVQGGSTVEKAARLAGGGLGRLMGTGAGFGTGGLAGAAAGYGTTVAAKAYADKVAKDRLAAVIKAVAAGTLKDTKQISPEVVAGIAALLGKAGATAGVNARDQK